MTESQVRKRLGDASGLSVLRAEAERDDAERQVADQRAFDTNRGLAFRCCWGLITTVPCATGREEALVALPARIAEALQHVDAEDVATQIRYFSNRQSRIGQSLRRRCRKSTRPSSCPSLRRSARYRFPMWVTLGVRSSQIELASRDDIRVASDSGLEPRRKASRAGAKVRAQARLAEARQQFSIEIEQQLA